MPRIRRPERNVSQPKGLQVPMNAEIRPTVTLLDGHHRRVRRQVSRHRARPRHRCGRDDPGHQSVRAPCCLVGVVARREGLGEEIEPESAEIIERSSGWERRLERLQPSDDGIDAHQPRLDLATAPPRPPPKDREPGQNRRSAGAPGSVREIESARRRAELRRRRGARGRRGPRRSHTPAPGSTTFARCEVSADGTMRSQHPNPLSEEQGARNEAPDTDRDANCRCLSVPDEE